jgi:SAM-dependent methyltransferase
MKQSLLAFDEVLSGYNVVSQLYPYIPSLCTWRAWEYVAYQRYTLPEPVLDVGCGDGHFFHLVWPRIRDVVGIDIDPGVVKVARQSGIYREVHLAPARRLPILPESFASAFANCSLEHMDHRPEVLSSICRILHHGGFFLFSVVTDKFLEWATLPLLIDWISKPERARTLQAEYETYHHLVNPLPLEVWMEHLEEAGFEILEHIPIVPEMTSRFFLFLDHLWHVQKAEGELGDILYTRLMTCPNFQQGFQQVLAGVLQMERDWFTGSGAIFWARRKG